MYIFILFFLIEFENKERERERERRAIGFVFRALSCRNLAMTKTCSTDPERKAYIVIGASAIISHINTWCEVFTRWKSTGDQWAASSLNGPKARATLVLFAPIAAKITYNGKERRVRKFGQLPKSDGCTERNNGVARPLARTCPHCESSTRGRIPARAYISATLPACVRLRSCLSRGFRSLANSCAHDFCVARARIAR